MRMQVTEERDLAEIVELANWSYRGREGDAASWNIETGIMAGPRTTPERLREERIEKRGGALLVFREQENGPIVGTIWPHPASTEDWHLSLLTVRPDRQAEGWGRRFFRAGEQWAAEHGARRIHLSVLWPREKLRGWYARMGYRETGEIEPLPYGDPRVGVPLRDDLHFVVMEREL